MSNSFIPYGPDPATIARRNASSKLNETRDGATADFFRDEVHVVPRRIYTFRGAGSAFRVPGSAALNQPIWSIENTSGSAVIVSLTALRVFSAQTVANLTHPPWYFMHRTTTMPTGGTAATKVAYDSTYTTSAANVIIRQGASADGTISAITAAVSGGRIATAIGSQLYTAVGTLQPQPVRMLEACPDEELILQAGQAYVLYVTTAAAADNLATRSFLVDFSWEEFTTF